MLEAGMVVGLLVGLFFGGSTRYQGGRNGL